MLKIQDLSFSYGKHLVLDHISHEFKPGTCTAIMGLNGSGKSTLLKCIMQLEKPSSGSIWIDDENLCLASSKEKAKQIAYVPQFHQLPELTVFDYVLLGRLPYFGFIDTMHDREIVEKILEQLNLTDFSKQYCNQLSGGEMQKVSIARALAQDTSIIILDEPTSSLDMKSQNEIIILIKQLIAKGLTVIITMHDVNLALRCATDFVFLKDKLIANEGNPNIINENLIYEIYQTQCDIVEINQQKVIIFKENK